MSEPDVHHVTLTVTDVRRSADWYQALLGPAEEVVRQAPAWERIRMRWPWGLVIGVTRHDDTGDRQFEFIQPGLDHLGLGCATEDEVRAWWARAEELGLDHGPVEEAGYGWAVTLRDPDGIAIEFFCPAV